MVAYSDRACIITLESPAPLSGTNLRQDLFTMARVAVS